MSSVLRAVLVGQHPSGKNQIQLSAPSAGIIRRFPQASFERWRGTAYAQLDRQRGAWDKLTTRARIDVKYWPGDLIRRDRPGMEDALFHLLEWCPVHGISKKARKRAPNCRLPFVDDDFLLDSGSWTQMPLDRERPRLELLIEPFLLEAAAK